MVKLKILKHVGQFRPGQIVEVEDDLAAQLLIVNHTTDGLTTTEHRRAMLLEEAEKVEAEMNDPKNLTLDEARAMGIKNIVAAPEDKEFDEALKARANGEEPPALSKKRGRKPQAQAEV